MKFKSIFLPLLTICFSLLTSCNQPEIISSKNIAIIEKEKGIDKTIEIKDSLSLNKMIGNSQSFILFIQEPSCACSINSRKLLNRIIQEKEIRIYEITDALFYESALSSQLVIGVPELTIINDGKVTKSVSMEKVWEKQIYTSNKPDSHLPILKHLEKYSFLNNPFYEVNDEQLKEKILNKESFLIFFKRNACGDCKRFNDLFLDNWILTESTNQLIYSIDLDMYRDNQELYQEIKDYYGLSVAGNKDFGYQTGVVPSLQKYENGILSEMVVIYNDQMEETEDGKILITDGYYDVFNDSIFESYAEYQDEVTPFYRDKFLDILQK